MKGDAGFWGCAAVAELQSFPRGTSFYRAYAPQPRGIIERGDGKFYRVRIRLSADGSSTSTDTPVCEDCWHEIPRYQLFPRGIVSPESDGDGHGNFVKARSIINGTTDAGEPRRSTEALQKVVCLPCYLKAFARVYPKARLPVMDDTLMNGERPPVYEPPMAAVAGVKEFLSDPGPF